MLTTLIYILEPDIDILSRDIEKGELVPDVGDYIEFDDNHEFPEEIRKTFGSLFKIEVRRIAYSTGTGYLSQSFVWLYVIPANEKERTYIYSPFK